MSLNLSVFKHDNMGLFDKTEEKEVPDALSRGAKFIGGLTAPQRDTLMAELGFHAYSARDGVSALTDIVASMAKELNLTPVC